MEKNLDNIIYFGVALEGDDILDFTTDFLAGVRSNYFNSHNYIEPSSSFVNVKGVGYTFAYSISKGMAMSWELHRKSAINPDEKGILLQKSKQVDNKSYCINTYNRLGIVTKKTYFDFNHNWLKTEYFSKKDNAITAVIKPVIVRNHNLIERITFNNGINSSSYLYPKTEMPENKEYTALAYTNSGFIFYNQVPCCDLEERTVPSRIDGFNFNIADFISGKNSSFDIRSADYLDNDEDIISNDSIDNLSESTIENLVDTQLQNEYNKMDEVLSGSPTFDFEERFDKTQSLLDELSNLAKSFNMESIITSVSDNQELLTTEDIDNVVTSDVSDEELINIDENEDTTIDDSNLGVKFPQGLFDSDDIDLIKNDELKQIEFPKENYVVSTEETPDSIINSSGENYKYFGDLINGKRHGHGRTATSKGLTAYEGNYADDKRNGFGAFYYSNGDINYLGNWKDNKRQGFGVGFRNTDFTAHIGKWNNNVPDGIGARFDENGNFLFLGKYINGMKQGFGVTLDESNNYIVSWFKDDVVISSYLLDDIFPKTE